MTMSPCHIPAAKLMPPSLGAHTVPRTEPCARICRAAAALTVLHAAAGFGKSTLMAQCRAALAAQGTLTLWLTLDRADNDAPRLLNALARAAEPVLDEPPGAVADLLQGLADAPGPWVLFIDELEQLQEAAGLALLRELVAQLPRQGRLIVGTRCVPELGLVRLRARGALLALDERDLRFSLDETAAFLAAVAGSASRPAWPAPLLHQVQARTEGWPMALALLAQTRAAAEPGADLLAGLPGTEPALALYLGEEVFARQPPALREFLLRTSVLQHLEPGLCQALHPRLDGAQVQARLAQARAFATPLEGPAPAWRYHRLFADYLRARQAHELPDETLRLHLLAAGWYEAEGRMAPAIDHAIAGEDWPLALGLLDRAVDDFLEQGRFRLLARWFGLLPPAALATRPLLQAAHLWALCLTQGAPVAQQWLDRYQLAQCAQPRVQAHLRALRPMLLAMQDQYARACEAGELALSQRAVGSRFIDGVLCNVLAHVSFVMGRQRTATSLLAAARPFGAFERLYRESTLGLMELREGRLRQAMARFRLALDSGGSRPGYGPGNAWVGVLYAYTQYETGHLDEADRLLHLYLPPARDIGLPDHMIGSYVMRARIAQSRGDGGTALQLLCELEHDGMQRALPRVAASASLERARLLLLQGQVAAAEQALQRAAELYPWAQASALSLPAHEIDDLALVRIRAHLAAGQTDAAAALIAHETANAAARPRRRLKLDLLAALLAWTLGQRDAASALLRPVLQACCREGHLQLVVDEGPALLALLQRCHAEIRNGPRAERDPVLQDHVERMLAALGAPWAGEPAGVLLADPLTDKESLVLRLLSDGCSNQAICDRLLLSDSTVRTHLRSINQKLGARSRAQAVAFARRLMLID